MEMASGSGERDDDPVKTSSGSVEITPAMIEAGYQALRKSGIADVYLRADKILVAEIFEAMFALLPALPTDRK